MINETQADYTAIVKELEQAEAGDKLDYDILDIIEAIYQNSKGLERHNFVSKTKKSIGGVTKYLLYINTKDGNNWIYADYSTNDINPSDRGFRVHKTGKNISGSIQTTVNIDNYLQDKFSKDIINELETHLQNQLNELDDYIAEVIIDNEHAEFNINSDYISINPYRPHLFLFMNDYEDIVDLTAEQKGGIIRCLPRDFLKFEYTLD